MSEEPKRTPWSRTANLLRQINDQIGEIVKSLGVPETKEENEMTKAFRDLTEAVASQSAVIEDLAKHIEAQTKQLKKIDAASREIE